MDDENMNIVLNEIKNESLELLLKEKLFNDVVEYHESVALIQGAKSYYEKKLFRKKISNLKDKILCKKYLLKKLKEI